MKLNLAVTGLIGLFLTSPVSAEQQSSSMCPSNFTTPSGKVITGMMNCINQYGTLALPNIGSVTGVSVIKILPGITLTPGTISVGSTYTVTQTISGIATGDKCIAMNMSTPVIGVTQIGQIQGLSANSGKVSYGNSGLVGVAIGNFTADLLCVHS